MLKFLGSTRVRIFLTAWILYSVHFATNIVREHYPAFSLVDHGTFFVDEYQGFHDDIFVHPNGHSVVGNQVFVSALAAIPLFIFDPVLDAIERYSKQKIAESGVKAEEYRTDKPNRVRFFRLVQERGLALRFGAAAVVTSAFFMAPLTAWFLLLMYDVLRQRGVQKRMATGLTFLFGFATPIFFRASHLNHNMFIMYAMFIAFVMLWRGAESGKAMSLGSRLTVGCLGGITLASDYMGVLILPLLYGYMLFTRINTTRWQQAFRESLALVVGSIPPILFLLYTQWSMYGNAFLPGQFWMPKQNAYTEEGMRGFDWPAPDLFAMNLFHPGYGIYTWGPILLLGLIPVAIYKTNTLILPRRERRFVALCYILLLLFCSANQYARLQWNSGFRYLLPMVPFIFLALSDHWTRMTGWLRTAIAVPVLLHSWVLTVFREHSLVDCWRLFFHEGVQLPWFRVLRQTSAPGTSLLSGQIVPIVVLAVTAAVVFLIWRVGSKYESLMQSDHSSAEYVSV